jgi:hypothetical protein
MDLGQIRRPPLRKNFRHPDPELAPENPQNSKAIVAYVQASKPLGISLEGAERLDFASAIEGFGRCYLPSVDVPP